MNLIIVESPTKARTLEGFLPTDFQLEATNGHIKDLPEDKIGVKISEDFRPEYVIVPGKEGVVKRLKKRVKKAKKVYLATDPDREGEAIAWHAAQIVSGNEELRGKDRVKKSKLTPPVARIVFHEITKREVEEALKNPRDIDMDLVSAQQGRRVLDRLVGYKLSPLLWFKIRRGLSAGRVQSVAVRLICEREREIEKFIPEEYWEIWVHLKKRLGGNLRDAKVFQAKLVKKNGKSFKIEDKKVASGVCLEIKKAGFEVEEIEKKEVRRSPNPPFRTATLAQAASSRFSWPTGKTMRVAQSLYEKGLITYHRTDSTFLSKQAILAARDYIKKNFGDEFLPPKPRIYKTTAKVAQEAHEAIRPTGMNLRIESGEWKMEKGLEMKNDEARLYDLIFKRFLSSQAENAIFDQTKVSILATGKKNHFLFEASGRVIKFPGFLAIYGKTGDDKKEELPELKKGDELILEKLDPQQKFTQPPSRYTEASLIRTLEENGVGRPSTYAPIISTIQKRQYVEKIEGSSGGRRRFFKPTALGTTVNDFLVEYFPEIVDVSFTARMENDLDEVANGRREWVEVVREFYTPFDQKLKSVSKAAERMKVPTQATDETCPECKAPLVIRIGRFGKFLSCSKFPECKFTKPYLEKAGFDCEKCGAPMVIKKTKKGKVFYGCSRYPDCDFATWRKPRS